MPHLPQSVHRKNFPCKTKSHFKPLFNDCYQVQFQKNLTYRFKLKVQKFLFKKKQYSCFKSLINASYREQF